MTLPEVLAALPGGDASLAFSISGGGASGTWECGAISAWWKATKAEAHLRPKLIVGTSAGALNAVTAWLDLMGITPLRDAEAKEPAFYGAALWELFGNRGAPYFVGEAGSAALTFFSKVMRWGPFRRRWVQVALAFLSLMVLDYGAEELSLRIERIVPPMPHLHSFVAALRISLIIAGVGAWLGRSLFRVRRLESTVAAAIAGGSLHRPFGRRRIDLAGLKAVRAWQPGSPELLVTSTNVTTQRATIFLLGSDETAVRLSRRGWHVHRFAVRTEGAPPPAVPWVDARDFVRCVAASASIPGVFPSQRIELFPARSTDGVAQDLVDGGVLHNAPVRLASNAGVATVVSLELDPLLSRPPLMKDTTVNPGGPRLPKLDLFDNVISTFSTLLSATTPEIERVVFWNHHLSNVLPTAGEETRDGARLVQLYRVAPFIRRIGTMEFNGAPGGYSLLEWMADGERLVSSRRCFWEATWEAAPAYRSTADDSPEALALLAKAA